MMLSLALMMFADAAAQVPQAPAPSSVNSAPPTTLPGPSASSGSSASARNDCSQPSADGRQIIICAERPQGYRLNPDVMEAKKEAHGAGRPVRPGGTVTPDCAHVGPAPCINAGINLLAAAATAAEMAQRLAKGQEVGSMFVTDPHPDEYHLYLMAKARREAEEKEKAALAKKAAGSETQAPQANTPAVEPAQPSH